MRDVRFREKGGVARALRTLRAAGSPAPEDTASCPLSLLDGCGLRRRPGRPADEARVTAHSGTGRAGVGAHEPGRLAGRTPREATPPRLLKRGTGRRSRREEGRPPPVAMSRPDPGLPGPRRRCRRTPYSGRRAPAHRFQAEVSETTDVRFVKGGVARAIRTLRAAASPGPADRVVPLSSKMVGLRFQAAARAAGVERVTAHSGRVGLASELTSRGASTTDVMLAGNWKTSRMVAHYSGVRP